MLAEPLFRLSDLPVPAVFATHRIIRDCNEEFASMFGYQKSELVEGSFSRLYPETADFIRTGKMWRSNLSGNSVYHDERVMVGADGLRFWCEVNGRAMDASDPFAAALYCFEKINRPISTPTLDLTGRQRQILILIAQGKTNRDIALELGLSRRTAEAHRYRLMRSAGVANSSELIAWFLSQTGRAYETPNEMI